jgi:hypothetical protein
MFAIQDKTTGKFYDIPDSEKLQLTITSSLFETTQLSGASSYELTLADSPNNAVLFNFIKEIDTSSKFVQKKQVLIWLDGSPYNDAEMTLRLRIKKGYKVYLVLGISKYIDDVLNTNIKSLNWPNNGKYHLLKELNELKYAIFGNNIAETETIQLDFETSKTQGPQSFSITNIVEEYSGGGFAYFKRSELDTLVINLNAAVVAIYDSISTDPEFRFSIYIKDAAATHAILELDGTTFTMSKMPMLNVTSINLDSPYDLLSPLRIDILKFDWSGGLDFSGNVNIGGVNVGYADYEYEETKDYSIQKEMKLMSDYSRTSPNEFPFVFAPFNNVDFFKTKPDSFTGQINAFDVNHTYIQDATTKYGCYFTNKQADSDLFEKYLVSPQMRLRYILERMIETFPNTFDLTSIFANENDDVTDMFSVLALYNTFAINQRTDANVAGTTFVSYLQKEVFFSDLLPSRRVIDLLLMVKNTFAMSLDFDFSTQKIKMKTFAEILEQTDVVDISQHVSIAHEKETAPFDSITLSFLVDKTDKIQDDFLEVENYIFLGEIPYEYRSPLAGPVPIQLLEEEFGLYFFEIQQYIIENEIAYDEIKDPKWFTKLIAKITGHGFYMYDTSVEVDVNTTGWKYIGTEQPNFELDGEKPLEISMGTSSCSVSENPDEGWGFVPIVKQPGNLRNTSGFFDPLKEDYNNDFEFRLFAFEYYRHYLISNPAIDVLTPFAKPLTFATVDDDPSWFNQNLPLYDYFYKKLDTFLKNTDKIPISLKVNSLFLKTYDPTKIYKIGSQEFIFGELRVDIPKKNLGTNERYSAEADVYIIRNYSV